LLDEVVQLNKRDHSRLGLRPSAGHNLIEARKVFVLLASSPEILPLRARQGCGDGVIHRFAKLTKRRPKARLVLVFSLKTSKIATDHTCPNTINGPSLTQKPFSLRSENGLHVRVKSVRVAVEGRDNLVRKLVPEFHVFAPQDLIKLPSSRTEARLKSVRRGEVAGDACLLEDKPLKLFLLLDARGHSTARQIPKLALQELSCSATCRLSGRKLDAAISRLLREPLLRLR
jgi:hypothetical protein